MIYGKSENNSKSICGVTIMPQKKSAEKLKNRFRNKHNVISKRTLFYKMKKNNLNLEEKESLHSTKLDNEDHLQNILYHKN